MRFRQPRAPCRQKKKPSSQYPASAHALAEPQAHANLARATSACVDGNFVVAYNECFFAIKRPLPLTNMLNTSRYISVLLAAIFPLIAHADEENDEPVTQVYIAAGELHYVGPLTADANARAMALFNAQKKKPGTLAIRSPGGDTSDGMELGAWVRQNKLAVKVLELCFSSCANYVFPAAQKKIVSNFAVVGYHGGLSSQSFGLADEQEAELDALPVAERAQARAQLIDSIKKELSTQLEQERQYFKVIGVQQRITTLGQAASYRKLAESNEQHMGWYYTIDDFAKLGVSNIQVINPPWRPRFIGVQAAVFRAKVR